MEEPQEVSLEQCFPRKERYECVDRNIAFTIYYSDDSDISGRIGLLCIHGAGYSGRTFALLAHQLKESHVDMSSCCLIAPDLRGHGDTEATDELDLSIETLVGDVEALYSGYLKQEPLAIKKLVMIGWSMGAAVAIKAALYSGEISKSVIGLVAIDVVEGTAIEALKTMSSVLNARPKGFETIEDAIEWAISSGTARRRESAMISVPGMLKEITSDEISQGVEEIQRTRPLPLFGQIPEASTPVDSSDRRTYKYTWRTPLAKSEKYWVGWFEGLSNAFLDIPCPKLLLLAGHDRLDTTLMIAQMQGKFQLVVIPKAGHAVHEDQPVLVAQKIAAFLDRYRLLQQ